MANELSVMGNVQQALTADTVKKYLVRGGGNVTEQEIAYFIELCKAQRLNPFIGDAYLVKYKSSKGDDYPAAIITSKEAFLKRAYHNDKFIGMQAGTITVDGSGRMSEREGSMLLRSETLVGGWARVFVRGFEKPVYSAVSMDEYNTNKSTWVKMPATMIRKCALVQALKEAFPDDFSNMDYAENMPEPAMPAGAAPSAPVAAAPTQTPQTLEGRIAGLCETCRQQLIDIAKLCEIYGVPEPEKLNSAQLDHIRNNWNEIKRDCAIEVVTDGGNSDNQGMCGDTESV